MKIKIYLGTKTTVDKTLEQKFVYIFLNLKDFTINKPVNCRMT